MSAADVAREIRTTLPGTEEIIVDYLSGYLVDDAGEDEDVLQVTHDMLESFAENHPGVLEELMSKLGKILEARLNASAKTRGPKLMKLDKVMEMGKAGSISNTLALSGGAVDLESINKAK